MRFAGEQFENRRDFCGAANVTKDQGSPAVVPGADRQGCGAQQAVEPGVRRADASKIVNGELVLPVVRDSHQAKVGETVLRAWQQQRTTSPEKPFPGQRKFHSRSLTAY